MKSFELNGCGAVPGGFRVGGSLVRTAVMVNEWYDDLEHPAMAVDYLRSTRSGVDLFTFIKRLPATTPIYSYPHEMDNVAAIEVETFDSWWEELPKSTRKHIRRAEKLGLVVRQVAFDSSLIAGISEVYNDTPLRSGRKFSHYLESPDQIKRTHGTFLDRSIFLAAFLNDEFVGFTRLILAGETARSIQLITKTSHQDKWPTNLLVMHAVKECQNRGIRFLVYGNYEYRSGGNPSLLSFKKENGFKKVLLPRYFIPLSRKGATALRVGLHHGVKQFVPRPAITVLRELRRRYYDLRFGRMS